jgi:hypothetical protein
VRFEVVAALMLLAAATSVSGASTSATEDQVNDARAPLAPKAPSASNTTAPKTPSLKECNKQADAKDLTGKDRASFVRACEAGKSNPNG